MGLILQHNHGHPVPPEMDPFGAWKNATCMPQIAESPAPPLQQNKKQIDVNRSKSVGLEKAPAMILGLSNLEN